MTYGDDYNWPVVQVEFRGWGRGKKVGGGGRNKKGGYRKEESIRRLW